MTVEIAQRLKDSGWPQDKEKRLYFIEDVYAAPGQEGLVFPGARELSDACVDRRNIDYSKYDKVHLDEMYAEIWMDQNKK